jgi:hypothetical protein
VPQSENVRQKTIDDVLVIVFALIARAAGPGFILAFYYLIYLHIDAFLSVITGVLI